MEIIRFFLCFGSASDFFYGVRILIDKKIRIQKLSLSTKNWFNHSQHYPFWSGSSKKNLIKEHHLDPNRL